MTKNGCPICGAEPVATFRPFCSERCSMVDLGRWLGGKYVVETNEAPDSNPLPNADEET